MVKNWPADAGDLGVIPGPLSLCATTTETAPQSS